MNSAPRRKTREGREGHGVNILIDDQAHQIQHPKVRRTRDVGKYSTVEVAHLHREHQVIEASANVAKGRAMCHSPTTYCHGVETYVKAGNLEGVCELAKGISEER